MVWPYVVAGLVIIIAILILWRTDSGLSRRRFGNRAPLIKDMTYVCMHCGHMFKGATCPKCGADRKPVEFGR